MRWFGTEYIEGCSIFSVTDAQRFNFFWIFADPLSGEGPQCAGLVKVTGGHKGFHGKDPFQQRGVGVSLESTASAVDC